MGGSKSVATARCGPQQLGAIVTFVDENAGPDGSLVSRVGEAAIELASHLNATCPSKDGTAFTARHVMARLEAMMGCVKEERLKGRLNLYHYGSVILDLSKFPPGTFSQADLAANQAVDTSDLEPVTNSPFTNEMLRVLIDFLEENKGEDGTFMRDWRGSGFKALDELKTRVPADKLREVNIEQVQKQYTILATSHTLGCHSEVEAWRKRNRLFRYGKSVLDHHTVRRGVFTQDEIDAWVEERDDERKAAKKKRQTLAENLSTGIPPKKKKRTSSVSNSGSDLTEIAEDAYLSSTQLGNAASRDSQQMFDIPVVSLRPDTSFVAGAMRDLDASIGNAVLRRLNAANIDTSEGVTLNLRQLDPDVTELLESVLACDRSELAAGISKLNEMRGRTHLPLDQFLQSLVGMALTLWTLRPNPRGNAPNKELAIFRQRLRQYNGKLARYIEFDVLNTFLTQEIVPTIKSRATELAERLDALLFRFMKPPSSNVSSQIGYGFGVNLPAPTYWTEDDEYDEASRTDDDPTPGPSSMDAPIRRTLRPRGTNGQTKAGHQNYVAEWKSALAKIFTKGMELRVKMEQNANGSTYDFRFPYPGYLYAESNGEGYKIDTTPKQRKVMLGLLPAVYVHVPTPGKGGQLSDRVAVAPHKSYDVDQ